MLSFTLACSIWIKIGPVWDEDHRCKHRVNIRKEEHMFWSVWHLAINVQCATTTQSKHVQLWPLPSINAVDIRSLVSFNVIAKQVTSWFEEHCVETMTYQQKAADAEVLTNNSASRDTKCIFLQGYIGVYRQAIIFGIMAFLCNGNDM